MRNNRFLKELLNITLLRTREDLFWLKKYRSRSIHGALDSYVCKPIVLLCLIGPSYYMIY